jgi:hypothetical protein
MNGKVIQNPLTRGGDSFCRQVGIYYVAQQGKRISFVGPRGVGSSPLFLAFQGSPFANAENYFLSNAAHRPGYSGTPVFADSDAGAPDMTAAVGMHIGATVSASKAMRGEIIEDLLK